MRKLAEGIPVLFISHGPPLVGMRFCPANLFLKGLGRMLPKPKAILSISAHWESTFPLVTAGDCPGVLYDFGGPEALRQLVYDPTGSPWLSEKVSSLLRDGGFETKEMERGFDHGTWIPLSLIYPKGDIPIVQLSIQTDADPVHHYHLGKALSTLRESGVLVLASGGAVHNLEEAGQYEIDSDPPEYARLFDRWLEKKNTSKSNGCFVRLQIAHFGT